jgi:Helix-turn-helix domain
MENQLQIRGLAVMLKTARREDGDPSFRYLQRKIGYSPSSISRVLAGKSFPRWEFTEKFLRACHVSEQDINGLWRRRWIEVAGLISPLGDTPAGDTPITAPVGTVCTQCGAWVINQILHQGFHAAYTPRAPGQTARKPSSGRTGTRQALRSLTS